MPKLITVSIWTLSSLWDSTCASFIRPDLQLWTNYELPSTAKHLPAMRKTWVRSLGREVPLEKEMATHSNILAWRMQRTEEPGRLQFTGSQRVRRYWATSFSFSLWSKYYCPYSALWHWGCDSAYYHSLSQLTSGQCLLIGGAERHWEAGREEWHLTCVPDVMVRGNTAKVLHLTVLWKSFPLSEKKVNFVCFLGHLDLTFGSNFHEKPLLSL